MSYHITYYKYIEGADRNIEIKIIFLLTILYSVVLILLKTFGTIPFSTIS